MWKIERTPFPVGPARWLWICAGSSHGLTMGYAWTKWGAKRKLARAERELYGGHA